MAPVIWCSYKEINTLYVSGKCLYIAQNDPAFVACFLIPE